MTIDNKLKNNPVAKELRTNRFRLKKIENKKKKLEEKRIKYDKCDWCGSFEKINKIIFR